MIFTPRSDQEKILSFLETGERMGVSAVPGSGKTAILSYLAARLVREKVRGDEEVLIVTFANSAVDNFARRIKEFLSGDAGHRDAQPTLLPDVGYRVRTLHGLAHDILRERPALLGLPEDFTIIDERVSDELINDTVVNWTKSNPIMLEAFIDSSIDENRRKWLSREKWPDLVKAIARSFIRRSKDLQMTPKQIRDGLPSASGAWLIGKMGADIYEDYERALSFRGGIDFDDLIRLALLGLQTDPQLLARLQTRWPYILEDEAQDSSELQEKILRLLTRTNHWVRVGDPNQSINTTFTTSNIRYLVEFLKEADVEERPIIHSGRSSQRIIDLANYLVDWTIASHPNDEIRASAFRQQHIEPTPPNDPQPNPIDDLVDVVTLYNKALNPDQELDLIVKSIARWLPDHQDRTIAVLVPDNHRGFNLAEQLKANDIPHDEMLRSTSGTREAARALSHVLRYLASPLSGHLLAKAYEATLKRGEDEEEEIDEEKLDALHKTVITGLRRIEKAETYLWPRPDLDWLAEYKPAIEDQAIRAELIDFRKIAAHWLEAASQLPIDQLILTVAQDLYRSDDLDRTARDLALAHKIAVVLRQIANEHSEYRLPDLASELDRVANNEQRFIGFGEDDLGFNPRAGRVTVATMHKAKGLEWDRVYLVGVNNYDFPSAEAHDVYRGETWYIRDGLNLEAEAIGQVEAIANRSSYFIGVATEKARLDYVAERLRLLYVGITRAKRELILTWNTGRREEVPLQPAAPFLALFTHMEEKSDAD
jgi:DNA helicase-2/ATP-dependent DNA helicase PcrA